MRLAVAEEHEHQLHGELIAAVLAACADSGLECRRLSNPAHEGEFDALLLLGYPHFYPSFLAAPRATRRICWYGENLPRQRATALQSLARRVPSARLLDLVHDSIGRVAGSAARDRLLRLREQAAVERELGRNLRELQLAHAWFDELAVSSSNRVLGAALAGWQARYVPFGYHAAMCGPIVAAGEGARDIDVLFLGRDVAARGRRARWLEELRSGIGSAASLVVVDGGVYGKERAALLARTRVVVDIHRVPHNSTGLRFLLAAAGGAALVTEETDDDWLPRRTECVIEVPRPDLASAVLDLLGDEPRRKRLVAASQELLRSGVSMAECLDRVLNGSADNIAGTKVAQTAR